MRKVVGIDVGFAEKKKTSCYCCFILNKSDKLISFLHDKPTKFNKETDISVSILDADIISMDSPLTPKLISSKPNSGRKIECLFSRDIFHNSKQGIQPGSIAVPKQGWNLYKAGMRLLETLGDFHYYDIKEDKEKAIKKVYEVIPKLTQSLLIPREIVRERGKRRQIDNYIFPMLFSSKGEFRYKIEDLLGDFSFDNEVQEYIDKISLSPRKYHEELAGIVCAFQGALLLNNNALIIGFEGEEEGYYLLPKRSFWDNDWNKAFERVVETNFKNVIQKDM